MIPLAHIQQWTARAPWPDLRQVEQDLIICRALCDLYPSCLKVFTNSDVNVASVGSVPQVQSQ